MAVHRQSKVTDLKGHIQAVRAATDTVSLIQETVSLRREGSYFRGSSPFTEDRNPSLVVWPDSQLWRDFSAGRQDKASDCFGWIQALRQCSFMEALSELAERAGMDRVKLDPVAAQRAAEQQAEKSWIEKILTEYTLLCHQALTLDVRKDVLLGNYGLTDQIVDQFKIGLAVPGLAQSLPSRLHCDLEDVLPSGLIKRYGSNIREFFVGRMVFPYWYRGSVKFIRGRCINKVRPSKNKYIGLPSYSSKNPHVSPLLRSPAAFNMDDADGRGDLWIAEGLTDAMAAKQAGLRVISPAGVRFQKRFTPWLMSICKRADRVIICPDQEVNGAGMNGALATAQELFQAGIDVRLKILPRAEGAQKVDLCSHLNGLSEVSVSSFISSFSTLPEVLVEQIPADTCKAELSARLRSLFSLMSKRPKMEVDEILGMIQRRFSVSMSALRADLKSAKSEEPVDTSTPIEGGQAFLLRGSIREEDLRYVQVGRKGQVNAISNFAMRPKLRITTDNDEIIVADMITTTSKVVKDVRLCRSAWHSKDRFLAALPTVDLVWTGTNENVQALLGFVAKQEIEQVRGCQQLGYFEIEGNSIWVTPDRVFGNDSQLAPAVVYAGDDHNFGARLSYDDVAVEELHRTAKVLLPALWKLNRPEVILPAIGWFLAAIVRPRIQRLVHGFPFLSLWGTQGCGKTSLIRDVLWPLVGVASSDPLSVTQTDYPTIRALASTSSIPVFFDEYKPTDMRQDRTATIHRVLRRVYGWEYEDRGKSDLRIDSRRLTAPVVLAGEMFPDQPALLERMIPISLDKSELNLNPSFREAYRTVVDAGPNTLANSLVRFLLGRNSESDMRKAQKLVSRLTAGFQMSDRVRDNLSVMVMGINLFREYAISLSVKVPEFEMEPIVRRVLSELGIGKSGQVKSSLDSFIEEVSELASMGRVISGEEYELLSKEHLALHLPGCLSALLKHRRETGRHNDLPDGRALSRMSDENRRSKGYVIKVKEQIKYHTREGKKRKRSIIVNLESANEVLNLEDFTGREE